ncbi:MAG: hypothetical protein A2042_01485 [Candidatus Schekmanbacteria bacterium GWA2_38_11]|uniref:Methyltransferase type 11 domain-containing protein n=1 Tax=Candidatus Schekmanbacteria bacterium GWA2_38_11 TaxID=1817876 RepID=A0A1F7RIT9_9BACT|nr:MAG: hypothetical protein A2042_01485 [Candidatus Schekmanbacteria bacterium GWA2_38_11]
MSWTKDTSEQDAVAYKTSFTKSIVGKYTDSSEQCSVVTSMRLNKNTFLLDAGCGAGRYLANTVTDQPFVGLDLSLEMLRMAREELKRGLFVVGELEHLPFKDNVFDEIICVRVLQHIKNQEQAIRELSRVCKMNGDVIVLCLNSWTFHCLYKNIRMSKLSKVINYPFKLLLGDKAMFSKWSFDYDNYCSLPEVCRLFDKAGLVVIEKKGGTIGSPWIFNYFYLGRFSEKFVPAILRYYFKICTFVENRLASVFPFNYIMDKIIVKGVKL